MYTRFDRVSLWHLTLTVNCKLVEKALERLVLNENEGKTPKSVAKALWMMFL